VTRKAVLDIDNSGLLLRPGMTATAEIKVTETADALLLPNSALRYVPPDRTHKPHAHCSELAIGGQIGRGRWHWRQFLGSDQHLLERTSSSRRLLNDLAAALASQHHVDCGNDKHRERGG
jgi:hypothetical protein